MWSAKKRLLPLDGIRGIAILMVVLFHYFSTWKIEHGSTFSERIRFYFYVVFDRNFLARGWCGVDIFFVLSGFLIVGILLDNRVASNYFQAFYIRRICRILPLYFLVLGLYCIGWFFLSDEGSRFHFMFPPSASPLEFCLLIQNFYYGSHANTLGWFYGWLEPTWSLAIEEQFYLVVPLLVYLLPRNVSLGIFIAALFFSPWLRYYYNDDVKSSYYTLTRLDSLSYGACLAFLVRSPLLMKLCLEKRSLIGLLFGAFFILTWFTHLPPGSVQAHTWYGILASLLILMGIVYQNDFFGRTLSHPWLVGLGNISFAFYLFHQVVRGLLFGLLTGHMPRLLTFSDMALSVLSLSITLMLAIISYRYLEQPIIRLGHRIRFQPNRPSEALIDSPAASS